MITVLTPTLKREAAWRHDNPSFSTAATTRSRRSIEYGFAIPLLASLPNQHRQAHSLLKSNPHPIQPKPIVL
ncbi:MAG: hypothetical protein ACXW48_23000 [Candidatus Binatia bacterium]